MPRGGGVEASSTRPTQISKEKIKAIRRAAESKQWNSSLPIYKNRPTFIAYYFWAKAKFFGLEQSLLLRSLSLSLSLLVFWWGLFMAPTYVSVLATYVICFCHLRQVL